CSKRETPSQIAASISPCVIDVFIAALPQMAQDPSNRRTDDPARRVDTHRPFSARMCDFRLPAGKDLRQP
ncbi:MAG: hypothetical protein WD069_18315, partial [Planctomycetales bacterium]